MANGLGHQKGSKHTKRTLDTGCRTTFLVQYIAEPVAIAQKRKFWWAPSYNTSPKHTLYYMYNMLVPDLQNKNNLPNQQIADSLQGERLCCYIHTPVYAQTDAVCTEKHTYDKQHCTLLASSVPNAQLIAISVFSM